MKEKGLFIIEYILSNNPLIVLPVLDFNYIAIIEKCLVWNISFTCDNIKIIANIT